MSLMVGSVRGTPHPSTPYRLARLVPSITGSRPDAGGPLAHRDNGAVKIDAPLVAAELRDVPEVARRIEADGFDGAYTFEGPHDPFLPLHLAAEHTERLSLMTAVAIAFARSPMTVAQIGWDLNGASGGRVVLGLGSQIRAHVERRYSMPWSAPAARMREFVGALRAIWAAWHDGAPLCFEGDHYR